MKGLGVTASMLMVVLSASAAAQNTTPPTQIPTPPIPGPAKLGPAPPIKLGLPTTPPPPPIHIPAPAELDRIAVPPEAAFTPPDKSDLTPPPLSAALTGPPPMVSPGANALQIEEVAFILDPGSSVIPAADVGRLREVAQDLLQDPASRLEVRVFSPSKTHSESTARRLSLSRFIAVRDVLKRNGLEDSRIDGRPLTSDPNELNADRVELYIER